MSILFSASAMDIESVDTLDSLNVPFIKIGSADGDNFPLLLHAASKKKPLIVSTGMKDLETVKMAYNALKSVTGDFCLLHCVSSYPVPPEQVNLRVINTYKKEFPDIHIGYSGHETGITASVGAVAMGAKVIERHITLNKGWKGSDHVCSLMPQEFQTMVMEIRSMETLLGSAEKRVQPCELPCYEKLGKTLVASKFLSRGHVLTWEDINVKVTTMKGCPSKLIYSLVGKTLLRNIEEEGSIFETDVL